MHYLCSKDFTSYQIAIKSTLLIKYTHTTLNDTNISMPREWIVVKLQDTLHYLP